MKTKFFYLLFIIIIFIFLSMNCFTTGGKRRDFSYNADKANADLISKTDLSSYIEDCAKAGIDYKDNKLYLAYDKDILQFDSNSLAFETTHNIFLDVTYDYNITSITHDNSYFYILANEFDQSGDLFKNYVIKYMNFNTISIIYNYENIYINKIMKIRFDKVINSLFSLVSIAPYHTESYFNSNSYYFLYRISLDNDLMSLFKIGDQNSFSRKYIQSFCYNLDKILISSWEDDGELGISGNIKYYNNQDYYTIWDSNPVSTIDASYLGDDDYVCIYDMVFDGTYLWCLVNDDDIDAYITGGGTPYLLKVRPKW